MDLNESIKSLILEGKSNKEISAALLGNEDLKEDIKGLVATDIAIKIAEIKKAEDLTKALENQDAEVKSLEEKKESDKAFQSSVKKQVNEQLKSINIDPFGSLAPQRKYKRYNQQKNEFVEVPIPSEAYKAFNDFLYAASYGDKQTAIKISEQIASDNQKKIAEMGIKSSQRSDDGAAGGYTLPIEVDDEIRQLTYLSSIMMQRSNTDVIAHNSKLYPNLGKVDVAYIDNQDAEMAKKQFAFDQTEIAMERVGGFTAISNTIIRQKGSDLVNAFVTGYVSAFARFLDLHILAGSVTGNNDKIDGILFNGKSQAETPIALGDLDFTHLEKMTENLSDENYGDLVWIGNLKAENQIGNMVDTGNNRYFPNHATGGTFSPKGIPYLRNTKLPSSLVLEGSPSRTEGTSTALILADMKNVIVGVAQDTRIDSSGDFLFTHDQMVLRVIKEVGWGLMFDNLVRYRELTV